MARRKIIEINRDSCDGCGLCVNACVEGALALDDEGKAVLVNEIYCDGMGVCLNVCPTGALKIVERETAQFDEEVARQRAEALGKTTTSAARPATTEETSPAGLEEICSAGLEGASPAGLEQTSSTSFQETSPGSLTKTSPARSELTQWPVQLHLVSPYAPYFRQAHLLVAADCTAFARGTFHQDLLRGRKLVVACPKLDDLTGYVEKLAESIRHNDLRSLTVAIMTVPCCRGLERLVRQALALAGVDLPLTVVVIGPDGEIANKTQFNS